MTAPIPCACPGPQFGERYCACEMRARGLPLNLQARAQAVLDERARDAEETPA